jgi:hypothetical protein
MKVVLLTLATVLALSGAEEQEVEIEAGCYWNCWKVRFLSHVE